MQFFKEKFLFLKDCLFHRISFIIKVVDNICIYICYKICLYQNWLWACVECFRHFVEASSHRYVEQTPSWTNEFYICSSYQRTKSQTLSTQVAKLFFSKSFLFWRPIHFTELRSNLSFFYSFPLIVFIHHTVGPFLAWFVGTLSWTVPFI